MTLNVAFWAYSPASASKKARAAVVRWAEGQVGSARGRQGGAVGGVLELLADHLGACEVDGQTQHAQEGRVAISAHIIATLPRTIAAKKARIEPLPKAHQIIPIFGLKTDIYRVRHRTRAPLRPDLPAW